MDESKKIVALGTAMYTLPLLVLSLQTTHVDGYIVIEAIESTEVTSKDGGSILTDSNNDGIVDEKSRVFASIHGYAARYYTVTPQDQQLFDDITSKL